MEDTALFGIAKEQWENIAAFATVLSAIASFAAVWVALHLAKQVSIPKVRFSVGHRVIVEQGRHPPFPEYVIFKVVNTGERTVRVSQIGWRVGLFKKRFAMQTFDPSYSSSLPVELSHGQEASYFIPLQHRNEPWLDHFAETMLLPDSRISCMTLRATMLTSIGNAFSVKPERDLLNKLETACRNVQHQST